MFLTPTKFIGEVFSCLILFYSGHEWEWSLRNLLSSLHNFGMKKFLLVDQSSPTPNPLLVAFKMLPTMVLELIVNANLTTDPFVNTANLVWPIWGNSSQSQDNPDGYIEKNGSLSEISANKNNIPPYSIVLVSATLVFW